MILPFYMQDVFDFPTALVLGTLLGFAFGFVLERSGFGRASVLSAQFYGVDNRVLKVMFSSIVTAMLGVVVMDGVGLLDLRLMTIPHTYVWPQLVGGLLLGVGFIVSGYCPGTSVVAAASGKLDGWLTVLGVVVGSLIFGFSYDLVSGFHHSGDLGRIRLPDILGVPQGVIAVAVAVMAVGAFIGAEKLEYLLARRRGEPLPSGSIRIRRRVFAGFGVVAGLGLVLVFLPGHQPAPHSRPFSALDAIELARILVEDPSSIYLVDLRSRAECEKDRLPGAMCLPEADSGGAFLADLPDTRTLVLYGAGPTDELPPGGRSFTGRVLVLRGGYAEFASTILTEPTLGEEPTLEEIEHYRLLAALHAYFTGAGVQKDPVVAPKKIKRTGKKKGGGC